MNTPESGKNSLQRSEDVKVLLISLSIFGLVFAVFWQTHSFSFVNFDDDSYVTNNANVRAGLSAAGLTWAFRHFHAGNWHPLTTLTHMLNCTLFGMNPAGHHLFSVTVHGVTAVLLFLTLRSALESLWSSAWMAAVFAVQPLHVESVAWIAELKDVLSGFFFVLTLWSYFFYARRPFSIGRYALVILFLTLGLMCKPMLVTLPFLLLVLDFWPLKRLGRDDAQPTSMFQLAMEKIPMVALATGCSFLTVAAQSTAINRLETLSLPLRLENATSSYAIYIKQTFLPIHLSAFYPFPDAPPSSLRTFFLLVLLVCTTALLVSLRQKQPWALVGWLWFLGMLVPVIGLVQAGEQAHADRYSYLPQLGLLLILGLSARELGARLPLHYRRLFPVLGAVSVTALAVAAWAQAGHWRNSESLWTQALRCDADNALAHLQLGNALQADNRTAEAVLHYRRAVEIEPSARSHNNLATVLELTGNLKEARLHYRLASLFDPRLEVVYSNWGNLLARQQEFHDAIVLYQKALALEPTDFETRNNLGQALGLESRFEEALEEFKQVLAVEPNYTPALSGLCETCKRLGRQEQAIPFLERACRDSNAARPEVLSFLAQSYAAAGKPKQAAEAAHSALKAAEAQGNPNLVFALKVRLAACLRSEP